jgi:hypothetical protein
MGSTSACPRAVTSPTQSPNRCPHKALVGVLISGSDLRPCPCSYEFTPLPGGGVRKEDVKIALLTYLKISSPEVNEQSGTLVRY